MVRRRPYRRMADRRALATLGVFAGSSGCQGGVPGVYRSGEITSIIAASSTAIMSAIRS